MIENIVKFKDFVPFFQTFLWILFIITILILFKPSIKVLMDRIKRGSSFKAGPIEIGEELTSLQSVEKMQNNIIAGANGIEREKHRSSIYKENKGIFLTHILNSSKNDGCRDIYIYLIKHKSKDFSDIEYVEFFFGHMWGNKIFKVKNEKKTIGIITSAYAPFLCTCLIKFKDGEEKELYRYIDFEMARKNISNIIE